MDNYTVQLHSRHTISDFHCNSCHGTLTYVQVLNDDERIQEDYFLCENCQNKIQSKYLQDEDIPEFYD